MLKKTGSAAGIVVKPQKGTTLKVMLASNVYGKPFCVLSHQSGNLLTTPRMCHMKTVLEYYDISTHSVTNTDNATTYFHQKWMRLESVSGIWSLKYSSECPPHVFHPSPVHTILLCQPLLALQFVFSTYSFSSMVISVTNGTMVSTLSPPPQG